MESNNRAGWVQMKYDRVDYEAPEMPYPEPAYLSEPMPAELPAEPAPMPPPVIPMPECDYENMVLCMSYVKKQKWGDTYEAEVGMQRGTIFPELDLPFVGKGACPHDE